MGILTESLKIAGNPSTGNAKVNWPGKKRRGPYTGENGEKEDRVSRPEQEGRKIWSWQFH